MSSDLFLQKMILDGEDVGTHSVLDVTYIERLDLTCPKLILTMVDRFKSFQDNAGLAGGSKLELVLGDAMGRGQEMFKESFIVGANWEDEEAGSLKVEAMQADIHRIKQPVVTPKFYVNKTVRQILADTFPDHQIVMDSYEFKHTYHINTGSTPSKMLERLKLDAGAVIYLSRGKVYFKLIKGLMSAPQAFQFDYKRNVSENPTIESYVRNNPRLSTTRRIGRDYSCWSRTEGLKQLKGDRPRQFLAHSHESHLVNHNMRVIPVMDCLLAGNGQFTPAQVVKFELNRELPDSVLDESVPSLQVMIGVRHYQQGMRFISVCEFGEVLNAN